MKSKSVASRREFMFAGLAALPFLKTKACADDCRPTVDGAGGPFYRKGAPWRTKLCGLDEPGEPLMISGTVTAADTCQPLKGAIIDVWQANAVGRYDNDDPRNPPDPDKFLLRGQMKTDVDGRYHFESILPGNYGNGGFMRAKHIHYTVSHPGYQPLTTECYFDGDKYNATDSLVRSPLIIKLAGFAHEKEKRKYLKGTFNVVLAKA